MKPAPEAQRPLESPSDVLAAISNEASHIEALSDLSEKSIRTLLTLAVRAYSMRAQLYGPVPATDKDADLTATDVAITVTALLEATDLELFEVAMWRSFGRPT